MKKLYYLAPAGGNTVLAFKFSFKESENLTFPPRDLWEQPSVAGLLQSTGWTREQGKGLRAL